MTKKSREEGKRFGKKTATRWKKLDRSHGRGEVSGRGPKPTNQRAKKGKSK